MNARFRARALGLVTLALAASLTACDSGNPTGVDPDPVVLMGRVVGAGTEDAAGSGGSGPTSGSSLAGIEVTVDGSTATTSTDASGGFRLQVEGRGGRVVIRFRRGALDARIALDGLVPGTVVRLDVQLSGDGGTVLGRRDDGGHEFQGRATRIALSGDAPARTLRVSLEREGRTVLVDIEEAAVRFESDGDVRTFAGLLLALGRTGLAVRIEGDGRRRDDGTLVALSVKVETDEHGQGDDGRGSLAEFKGVAALVSANLLAAPPSLRVRVSGDKGSWLVDVVEGETRFDASGDFRSVGALAAALSAPGLQVRFEGTGTRRADGSVVAASVRARLD